MNVAYVSLDQVNEVRARRLTRAQGMQLAAFWPTEAVPQGDFPIVIYDLDYLPAEHRDQVLRRGSSRRKTGVVAVHGYNLTRRQRTNLRRQGVVVSRRFGRRLLSSVLDRAAGGAARLSRVA